MHLKFSAKIYLWVVTFFGLIAAIYYISQVKLTPRFSLAIIVFSVIAFLCEVYEVEIVYKRRISAATAVRLAAIFLGGAPLGILTVLIATLAAEIILRWDTLSKGILSFMRYVLFNLSQLILTVAITSAIFFATGGHFPPYTTFGDYVPPIVAFLIYVFVNTSLVSGIIAFTEGISFTYHLRFSLKYLHVQLLSLGVLSVLLAVVYAMSPWGILLILIPLALVHYSLRSYTKLRTGAKRTFEKMMETLAERDPYTFTHSEEVAKLSEKIARILRLPEDEVEEIKAAARIHDIGKIGVPDSILLKRGELTDEEWEAMKRHPVIGADILQGLEVYDGSIDIIRHEHERWDGSGYPNGLKGKAIPIGARIVAVADVYNALTSDRPYREAFSKEEALKMIEEMKGIKLDPEAVEALFKIIKDKKD